MGLENLRAPSCLTVKLSAIRLAGICGSVWTPLPMSAVFPAGQAAGALGHDGRLVDETRSPYVRKTTRLIRHCGISLIALKLGRQPLDQPVLKLKLALARLHPAQPCNDRAQGGAETHRARWDGDIVRNLFSPARVGSFPPTTGPRVCRSEQFQMTHRSVSTC